MLRNCSLKKETKSGAVVSNLVCTPVDVYIAEFCPVLQKWLPYQTGLGDGLCRKICKSGQAASTFAAWPL